MSEGYVSTSVPGSHLMVICVWTLHFRLEPACAPLHVHDLCGCFNLWSPTRPSHYTFNLTLQRFFRYSATGSGNHYSGPRSVPG